MRRDASSLLSTMDGIEASATKRVKLAEEERLRREAERKAADAERENKRLLKILQREEERKKREEERLAEKKRKEEERAAEKRRKDEEKLAEKKRKDEERLAEKARKDEERRAEKARKDEERAAEKARKDEEKARKEAERAQKDKLKSAADQSRINAFFVAKKPAPASSPSPAPQSDYERHFLPFSLQRGGRLFDPVCNYAPVAGEHALDAAAWLKLVPPPRRPADRGALQQRLALARDAAEAAAALAALPLQRLQFSHLSQQHVENPKLPLNAEHRPPFVGFRQLLDLDTRRRLARDPLQALNPDANYEYDSELEWAGEEDGEDLRLEESDDESGGEQYELNEFLSDDDRDERKVAFTGPLTPQLLWDTGLDDFSIIIVPPESIEPHAEGPPIAETAPAAPPFVDVVGPVAAKVGFDCLRTALEGASGSGATKTLHIELLKQRLPGATEKELKRTFELCAMRVGKKKHEKKWVLTRAAQEFFGLS